jgi:hypothetical protein
MDLDGGLLGFYWDSNGISWESKGISWDSND